MSFCPSWIHCFELQLFAAGGSLLSHCNSQQLFSPHVHNHQKTFTKHSQQLVQAAGTDGCCSTEPLQPCNGVVRLEHITWLWHHIVTSRGNFVLRWDWQLPPSLSSSCVTYYWKGTAVSINKTQEMWSRPDWFVLLMDQEWLRECDKWQARLLRTVPRTTQWHLNSPVQCQGKNKKINRSINYSAKLRIIWTNLAT